MAKDYYLPKVYLKSKRSLNSVGYADRVLTVTPGEYRRDIVLQTEDDIVSGGSTTVSTPYIYEAGTECYVMATDTTVVYDRGVGIGSVYVPEDVILYSVKVSGSTSELSSNKFTVRFNFEGSAYNQDIATFFPPLVQVLNTTSQLAGGPASLLPFVYDEGSTPQIQLTRLDSGILDITIINLNQFSNWTIICVF